MKKKTAVKKKKTLAVGIAHVCATFNNTIVSITDMHGDVVVSASAGCSGFKGSRKSTPYAAQVAAESAARKAMELGLKTISVKIKGPGSGRESAVRALASVGLTITAMKDVTPVPFNGCRPPKRRRI